MISLIVTEEYFFQLFLISLNVVYFQSKSLSPGETRYFGAQCTGRTAIHNTENRYDNMTRLIICSSGTTNNLNQKLTYTLLHGWM